LKCFKLHFSLYKLKLVPKYILSVYLAVISFNVILFGYIFNTEIDVRLILYILFFLGFLMTYILIILKDTLIRMNELCLKNVPKL